MNLNSNTEDKTILEYVDDKVDEIAAEFKKSYKNIDELYYDTF